MINMTLSRVHVNRHLLARNAADGLNRPVYSVKRNGEILYAHGVIFTGHTELIDPRVRVPLSCGARCFLETYDEIMLIEPCSFAEAQMRAA